MKATDELREDHKIINEFLEVMTAINNKIAGGDDINGKHLTSIANFLKDFADTYHHGREEELFFPALEAVGIPSNGGPVGVMLNEHVTGRELTIQMKTSAESYNSGDKTALKDFMTASEHYVEHLMQHIDKENNILFNMADAHLHDLTQVKLCEQFEVMTEATIGRDGFDKYVKLLETMKKEYLV